MKINKSIIFILIILNAVVLLGQILPEGAPPFARIVNIIFLSMSFTFFIWILIKNKSETK
jgi:hypothetical protein